MRKREAQRTCGFPKQVNQLIEINPSLTYPQGSIKLEPVGNTVKAASQFSQLHGALLTSWAVAPGV